MNHTEKRGRLKSTTAQILARARQQTGIDDIVDADIAETLDRFVAALNSEAELHEAGAAAMEWHLLLVLCNRLRMLRDFRDHPEIGEQAIERPLILSGAARTGSTKLQKMLAAGGDFKFLPCWQGVSLSLLNGKHNEDPSERIQIAEQHVSWFNDHAPEAKLIHEFSTREAEEENLILAQRLFGPYMIAFVFVPTFIQWYMTNRDIREDILFLKQGLQYLQWQFHDGDQHPWLLKNPLWPGLEPLLAEAFPGATFIGTHREPVSTISSSLSLIRHYHVAYSDVDRRQTLGPMMLEGLALSREQQKAVLDAHPEIRPLDVGYSATTKDAITVIENIYAHAGIALSAQARQAMCDWERDNAQHKLGVHAHGLDEFGLTPASVEQRFGAYIARQSAGF